MANHIRKRYKLLSVSAISLALVLAAYIATTYSNLNPSHHIGNQIDSFNDVAVFFNGGINQTHGRNVSDEGYNIGIRYQCVEFVKRYYYQRFNHRLPDPYGSAKDLFDPIIVDGGLNPSRGLFQFRNGSLLKPEADDILVFSPWVFNPYGHVAIISRATNAEIEIIQQNPGPFGSTRETYSLSLIGERWYIDSDRVFGWLRLPRNNPQLSPMDRSSR